MRCGIVMVEMRMVKDVINYNGDRDVMRVCRVVRVSVGGECGCGWCCASFCS